MELSEQDQAVGQTPDGTGTTDPLTETPAEPGQTQDQTAEQAQTERQGGERLIPAKVAGELRAELKELKGQVERYQPLEPWQELIGTLAEHGVTPQQLEAILTQEAAAAAGTQPGTDAEDPDDPMTSIKQELVVLRREQDTVKYELGKAAFERDLSAMQAQYPDADHEWVRAMAEAGKGKPEALAKQSAKRETEKRAQHIEAYLKEKETAETARVERRGGVALTQAKKLPTGDSREDVEARKARVREILRAGE